MQIIDRILELIKTNGITEYRVMKDCSLQANSFTYWKNGRAIPSLDALKKIALYFNVSLDYLVGIKSQNEQNISLTCQPLSDSISQGMENSILEKINELIKHYNITPNKLLVSCGLQSNAFTKWKNGIAKPSLDALIKIANYFNVSIDYLVGREVLNNQDISNNATISPVFNRFCKLTEIQQAKVMAYMDGLESLENTFNTRQIISNIVNDTPSVKKENHKEVIDQ